MVRKDKMNFFKQKKKCKKNALLKRLKKKIKRFKFIFIIFIKIFN